MNWALWRISSCRRYQVSAYLSNIIYRILFVQWFVVRIIWFISGVNFSEGGLSSCYKPFLFRSPYPPIPCRWNFGLEVLNTSATHTSARHWHLSFCSWHLGTFNSIYMHVVLLVFLATNPCSSGHGCQHVYFKGSNNQPTCACYANYELESDGKKCKGAEYL